MSTESVQFKGFREHWRSWKKSLRIKLMEHGLERVAYNKTERPQDIDTTNWAWESESNKEKSKAQIRKEQRDWDIDNEKAFAVIVKHLHPDISRQLEGKPQDGISHTTLIYLEEKYGGEHDPEALAAYLKATAIPLSVTDTLEMFISRFEENHREAGTDMNNGDALLAHLRVVLADHHRSTEALKRIRQNKMNWGDAKKCLIEEDRANPQTSYTAKEVSFMEQIKVNKLNTNSEPTITKMTQENTNENRKQINYDNYKGRSKSPDRNRDRSRSRDRNKNRSHDYNKAKYNREDNNTNDKKICFQFRDKGSCKFGNNCKFIHEKILSQQTTCKYWTAGNCKKGGNCRFKHE